MPSKMSSRPLKAPRLLETLSPGPEPRIPGLRRLEPVVPAISITPSLAGSRVKRREATRAVPNYALDVQCGILAGQVRSGMRGYSQDKDAYLKRLRRIEGQVRGL